MARRGLAAYPAVNSPDDHRQHDERLLERRWISSREDGQMLKLHRYDLGRADAAMQHRLIQKHPVIRAGPNRPTNDHSEAG